MIAGVDRAQRLVVQADAFEDAGPHVLDHDVAHGDETPDEVDPFRSGEVEGNAQLAEVDGVEHHAFVGA